MSNLIYLIGRLIEDPKSEKSDDKEITKITIAVQRSYKNADGVYENDIFTCILWNGLATHTNEYCHKNDLVSIKGRLQSRKCESYSDDNKYYNEIVVDKLSYLSSKRDEN